MVAPARNSARIGSYVLGERLHSTGIFEVWQSQYVIAGRQTLCDGEFIVKRLLPELAENPRLVEQYAQRGERAKRLRHDGIANVVDVVVSGEDCCVVCEPLEGYSLREILERLHQCENALPVWFAIYVTCRLSSALLYAHSGGISQNPFDAVYHQDVSAENVIITVNGEVKLVDFGLSRSALLGIEVSGTRRWSDSGEFDLWAPHFGDVHSDIQGLGRLLYELLTGRAPGKGWIPPSHYAAWITSEFDSVLRRMLGTSERYASMQDVCSALDELSSRQRQAVDSTHLSGLLRVVMFSMPPLAAIRIPPSSERYVEYGERRSATILPAASCQSQEHSLPQTLPETIERLETVLSAMTVEPPESSSRERRQARRQSSHDWDAAIDSVRRTTIEPPPAAPAIAQNSPFHAAEASAMEYFERGLELLKQGDLPAAEEAWLNGLCRDPNHRLCQVNLNLLRKLRGSKRPTAI